jgi:hypothetical protein
MLEAMGVHEWVLNRRNAVVLLAACNSNDIDKRHSYCCNRSGGLNLPLFDVPLSRFIMRPSIAVPRPSVSQTASD